MMEDGYYLVFEDHKVEIYDDSSCSNMVAKVQMRGNQSFPMKLQSGIHTAYKASVCHFTTMWHKRLGHLNMSSLKLMQEQEMFVGLPEIKAVKEVCEGCVLGKQCREAFPREATTRASTLLELIHSDICRPMQTVTKAGNRYKSEVFNVFKRFKAIVELQSGYKLKKLRSDKGGEYTSIEFNRQLTVAYSPQHNGVAERKNKTIVEMAKCMMFEKKMPQEFWAEAVNTEFELASTRCVSLGYGSCEKGYRLYNIASGRVVISRDVVLNEEASWNWNAQKECSVSIPLTDMLTKKEKETDDASLTQAEISEEEPVEIGSGPQEIDHTPLKYKNIAEIYERCNLCIIELETFEEVVKDES
ncbi:unnamed protein product [Prunus armeniaca]